MSEDGLVDRLWDELRRRCCASGVEAKRIVMVSKRDLEAAIAAIEREDERRHQDFLRRLEELEKRPPPQKLVNLMNKVPIWEQEENK